MIKLVGLYDSPFVRRVAIALNHYGIAFERGCFPALEEHRETCEALPIFIAAAHSQSEALAAGWRPEQPQEPLP